MYRNRQRPNTFRINAPSDAALLQRIFGGNLVVVEALCPFKINYVTVAGALFDRISFDDDLLNDRRIRFTNSQIVSMRKPTPL